VQVDGVLPLGATLDVRVNGQPQPVNAACGQPMAAIARKELILALKPGPNEVVATVQSADGKQLGQASASIERQPDPPATRRPELVIQRGLRGQHYKLHLSPDENTLLAETAKSVLILSADTGRQVGSLPAFSPAWEGSPRMAWWDAGRHVVAPGAAAGTVSLWDIDRRTPVVSRFTGLAITDLAASPKHDCLAVVHQYGNLQLLDAHFQPLGELKAESLNPRARLNVPWRTVFSPDGHQLLVSYSQGWVALWDVPARRQIVAWQADSQASDRYSAPVAFDAEGRPVTLSEKGLVTAWRGATPVATSDTSYPEAWSVSRHGERLMLQTGRGAVLLDAALRNIRTIAAVTSTAVASPGNDWVYGAEASGALGKWPAAGGAPAWRAFESDHAFSGLKISRDGRIALTTAASAEGGRADAAFRVWDLEQGRPLATMAEAAAPQRFRVEAELSPNGEWLATASDVTGASLWRTRSGQPLALPPLPGRTVTSLAFDRDGTHLAVATVEASVATALLDAVDKALEPERRIVGLAFDQIEDQAGPIYQRAVRSRSASIQVWSLQEQRWVGIHPLGAVVSSIEGQSPGGEWLLGGLRGEVLALSKGQVSILRRADKFGWNRLTASPNGKRLLRALAAEQAVVWERQESHLVEIERIEGNDATQLLAAAWGADSETLVLNEPGTGLRMRRIQPARILGTIDYEPSEAKVLAVSAKGSVLLDDDGLVLLDTLRQRKTRLPVAIKRIDFHAQFLDDGQHILYCEGIESRSPRKWSVITLGGRLVATFTENSGITPLVTRRGGRLYYVEPEGDMAAVHVLDLQTRLTRRLLRLPEGDDPASIAFADDERKVFIGLRNGDLVEWVLGAPREFRRTRIANEMILQIAATARGDRLLLQAGSTLVHWDAATQTRLGSYAEFAGNALAFAADGKQAHLQSWKWFDNHTWIDLGTGATVRTLEGKLAASGDVAAVAEGDRRYVLRAVPPAAPAPIVPMLDAVVDLHTLPGRHLAIGLDAAGVVGAWRLNDGRRVLSWASLGPTAWFAVEPEGRYDASRLDEVTAAHWVLGPNGRETAPVDVFMQSHYQPGLLAQVLGEQPLPPVEPFAERDRRTAEVSVKAAKFDAATRRLAVEVELAAPPNGAGVALRDLKIFVNGRLAARAFDSQALLLGATAVRHRFADLLVPGISATRDVVVSVYGFNANGVRTTTARAVVPDARASDSSTPRSHVVAIGIDDYDHAPLRLRFARADASAVAIGLSERLGIAGRLHDTRVLLLMSAPARPELTSKRHILRTLAQLAEGSEAVRPGDTLVISFAGHGMRNAKGEFFLLARDYQPAAGSAHEAEKGGISMAELADALLPVQPAHWVLLIDACHSAATVTAGGFKPGPTDSRGLGQLAFDKGMRVLAASQEAGVAIESDRFGGGLLTHALMRDGLGAGLADHRPRDGRITVGEWMQYANLRVPELSKYE